MTISKATIDRILLSWAAVLVLAVCLWIGLRLARGTDRANSPRATVRVLFLGNSYTYGNDLPQMFADLAESAGYAVRFEMSATGGWQLADHVEAPATARALESRDWDYAVLQEQSTLPLEPDGWRYQMYPAAHRLARDLRSIGTTPILFMTWARRDGLESLGYPSFEAMQMDLTDRYRHIARELSLPLAPVGVAWREVRLKYPALDLYADDGSHPSLEGSYLAACVIFASMFGESPRGLAYDAGISDADALVLQQVAAEVVLTERSHQAASGAPRRAAAYRALP